jgi:N-acetylmuramoyl-L-alanine amidase
MLALPLVVAALLQGTTATPSSATSARSAADSAELDLPASLSVRGATRAITVKIVGGTASVRADQIVPALGGRVTRGSDGTATVTLPGISMELVDGLPYARTDRGVVPLPSAPRYADGIFWLPLAVVTDAFPRLANGVLYDAEHAEFRIFGMLGDGASLASATRTPLRSRPSPARSPAGPVTPVSTPRSPLSSAASLPAPSARGRRLRATHIVIVDAGHGGPDRGMHGPWGCSDNRCLHEADITLQVAGELSDALRARGLTVVMTRSTDTLIALSDRGKIANRAKGDLFLSVHVNAANPRWKDPGSARGYETYFLSEAKTEDEKRVARMENESIRFETDAEAPKGDDLSFLLNDMAQNEHLRESNELAQLVQEGLGRIHPGPSRGVKQAGFRVLVTAFMPAVLIEIGFGTNPGDARWISDGDAQRRIAAQVADAAVEYLARYERRVNGGN